MQWSQPRLMDEVAMYQVAMHRALPLPDVCEYPQAVGSQLQQCTPILASDMRS
jgi:hypothetical protein